MDNEEQQHELDLVLAALAHEVRRHVLLVVWCHGGALGAGEIAGLFPHSWPTTSRHLHVLEQAGLLTFEKQGRTRVYRVSESKLQLVRDWLRWFQQIPVEKPTGGVPVPPELLLGNIALAYPEATEEVHGTERLFKVKKRAFLILADEGDCLRLSVKLPDAHAEALKLPFVQAIRYRLGKSDWVSARLSRRDELPIELFWDWLDESYRAVAPRRLLRELAPPPRADW